MGRLQLVRPLIFLDLETTGLYPVRDRIVEIALMRITPPAAAGGAAEPVVRTQRINPGVPIPAEATRIHGITDADVAYEPAFADVAPSLLAFLAGCDFAGFGLRRFDLPFLAAEFQRAGLRFNWRSRHCVDGKEIFHFKEPRTLSAAYAIYCGGELRSAHSAEADMVASRDVLLGMLERYEDLPLDVESLARVGAPAGEADCLDAEGKLRWEGAEVVLNIGAHRGRTLRDAARTDRGLLEWILARDFSEEVKRIVREALAGCFPVRPVVPDAPAATSALPDAGDPLGARVPPAPGPAFEPVLGPALAPALEPTLVIPLRVSTLSVSISRAGGRGSRLRAVPDQMALPIPLP